MALFCPTEANSRPAYHVVSRSQRAGRPPATSALNTASESRPKPLRPPVAESSHLSVTCRKVKYLKHPFCNGTYREVLMDQPSPGIPESRTTERRDPRCRDLIE